MICSLLFSYIMCLFLNYVFIYETDGMIFQNTGQVSQDCSAPDKYPNTKLETKYARRQKFSHNEKVYYSCDDDFTAFSGSRAVQCVDGQWTKLTLKCESKNLP